jgi:hypothetical protein
MKFCAALLNLIGLLASVYVIGVVIYAFHLQNSPTPPHDLDLTNSHVSADGTILPKSIFQNHTKFSISSSKPSITFSTRIEAKTLSTIHDQTQNLTPSSSSPKNVILLNNSSPLEIERDTDEVLNNLPLKSLLFFSCVTLAITILGFWGILSHRVALVFLYCLLVTLSLVLRLFGMMRWAHYSSASDALVDAFFVIVEVSLIVLYFRLGCILKLSSDLQRLAQGRRREGPNISQELKNITCADKFNNQDQSSLDKTSSSRVKSLQDKGQEYAPSKREEVVQSASCTRKDMVVVQKTDDSYIF